MGLFVTSISQANLHGAYVFLRPPPAIIRAQGTGVACLLGQFPWGPVQTVYKPTDPNDRIQTFSPFGMDQTNTGFMAMSGKAWPQLWVLRVLGSGSVASFANLPNGVPTNIALVTLKYGGTAGNSVTWTVAAATDGNAQHFNLTVSVTSASGTTSDIFQNLNYSGTGADSIVDCTQCRLVGSVAKVAAGTPVAGSGSFAGGTNGAAVASTDYVGTQGSGNIGLAKTEGTKGINHIFTDDCSNGFRVVVNTGVYNHCEFMGTRMGYVNGNSGITATAAQTEAATYLSKFIQYVDVWPYINRAVDGVKTLVTPAPFLASVAANLPPSAHPSWKHPTVTTSLLSAIVDLEADRGVSAANNTTAGVVTLQREDPGGYSFEADVCTLNASDTTQGLASRTRMAIYVASAFTAGARPSIDGPNVPLAQQPLVDALDDFLAQLKANGALDPWNLPFIVDYQIDSIAAFNSAGDIANGNFTVPATIKTDPGMQRLFASLQIGENPKFTVKP